MGAGGSRVSGERGARCREYAPRGGRPSRGDRDDLGLAGDGGTGGRVCGGWRLSSATAIAERRRWMGFGDGAKRGGMVMRWSDCGGVTKWARLEGGILKWECCVSVGGERDRRASGEGEWYVRTTDGGSVV